ncbi:MAG: WbuC family cupin fold metalloprotein [Paludibacter sp.]|jgi:cupin fold WbuC family metalloprotein|nr:WbuC family cupin fold metalloprotein [Paludibacter sp.]MDD3488694.1 WbuC family cupin fold metalloprotein [Paludibacter sp.]
MKIIDSELLDGICKQAKENPRLRMNYNLHTELDEPVQRLLNALEPGTEIPVHRHRHSDETYLVIRGSLFVILFDENKKLLNKVLLDPKEGTYGVSVPAGQWHSIEVLESDTVIFEIKEGPYMALTSEDIL